MRTLYGKITPMGRSDMENPAPLFVNNIGSVIDGDETMRTERPTGRNDYQLIHITDGELTVIINGREISVGKNGIILFRPHQPQIYYVNDGGRVSYDWLHFVGQQSEYLIEKVGLTDTVCSTENGEELSRLFRAMLDICLTKDINEPLLVGYAIALLSMITAKPRSERTVFTRIIAAIKNEEIYSTRALAEIAGVTESHFIRAFKRALGKSPQAYITDVRIKKAKHLLGVTTMSVSDISAACKYDDPLYFSRVFKKCVGVSPRQYRES